MKYLQAYTGILLLLVLGYVFSRNRKAIDWALVGKGLALQLVFGFLIIKVSFVHAALTWVGGKFVGFLNFSQEGAEFLFGDLAKNSFSQPANHNLGVIIAFQVLPVIVFFSAISSALYYYGILQKLVRVFAWVMNKTLKISGAESLSAAGNVFLGQAEAPLLVRHFVPTMTRSEINCLMTVGMSTIAGTVMAAYINMLGGADQEMRVVYATHLISASIMNVPAGIIMAKMLVPETQHVESKMELSKDKMGVNILDAITRGTGDGVKLAVNVGAMLLVFIALIALLNHIMQNYIGSWLGVNEVIAKSTENVFSGLSFEYLLGQVFRGIAWVAGVPWEESLLVGSLLGTKTIVNEFVAYDALSVMKSQDLLSEKSVIIATYALCGFSNFGSIAIQIGGISIIAPERKADLSRLGIIALLGASIACLMTGTLAGALT